MTEWVIASGAFAVALLMLIFAVPRMKRKPPSSGGFAVGLFMTFASVLDPARGAAVEQLDRQKETKGAEEGENGAGAN